MNEAIANTIRHGQAKLQLRAPLTWTLRSSRVRAVQRLRSELAVPIHLVVCVPVRTPGRVTLLLHDGSSGSNNAFRLDVRGSHGNSNVDNRVWNHKTHLHVWSDAHKARHAIDPFDPPWPTSSFDESTDATSSQEIERLFDLFCTMFHIELGGDYHWTDPLVHITEPEELVVDGDVIP